MATIDDAPRHRPGADPAYSRPRRRRSRRRIIPKPLLRGAVATLAISAALIGPSPVQAAEPIPSACPELTDSVRRIFIVVLLREPDVNEAFHWTDRYMTGTDNLPEIAGHLIRSREFEDLYGSLTSLDFVEQMYHNARRPSPLSGELNQWVRALDTGLSRGEMVMTLVESEDFVNRTGTTRPLAGYLRWYPPGTHWYCGSGPRFGLSVTPLIGQVVFTDRLIRNNGDVADDVTINTVEAGLPNAVLARGVLSPGVTDYRWFSAIMGSGFYGAAVDIDVRSTTQWMIVFYDQPMIDNRLGWQIEPTGSGRSPGDQ